MVVFISLKGVCWCFLFSSELSSSIMPVISYQNKLHPSNLSPVLAKASLLLEQLQDNEENTDSVQVINYLKVMKWGISAVQF